MSSRHLDCVSNRVDQLANATHNNLMQCTTSQADMRLKLRIVRIGVADALISSVKLIMY